MTDRSPTTPQGHRDGNQIIFSPVKTPVPEGENHRQGNLTGTLRKVKDTAADVHNQLIKWNKLNIEGQNITAEIANIKLEQVFSEGEDNKEEDCMPQSLEPLCEKLTAVTHNMDKVVLKLEKMHSSMSGLETLQEHQGKQLCILFNTWTVSEFVIALSELVQMYRTELNLKKCIAENVAHASSRIILMFYTAAWLHQPYIEHRAELLLESMLMETGHK